MSDNGKDRIIAIIERTFDLNPSVNSVIGKGGNRRKKLSRLARFAYEKSKNKNGIFLSANSKGTALCFRSDAKGYSISELISEVKFAYSIPISKVFQTLRRESYIKKHRLQIPHLYFWFFGVESGGGDAAFELKNKIFNLSFNENLPILLETSVPRNRSIYERYGFQVYHEWVDENGTLLWFMSRNPQSVNRIK